MLKSQIRATGNVFRSAALEAFNKIKRRGAGKPLNTPDETLSMQPLLHGDRLLPKIL